MTIEEFALSTIGLCALSWAVVGVLYAWKMVGRK